MEGTGDVGTRASASDEPKPTYTQYDRTFVPLDTSDTESL